MWAAVKGCKACAKRLAVQDGTRVTGKGAVKLAHIGQSKVCCTTVAAASLLAASSTTTHFMAPLPLQTQSIA